MLLAGAEHMTEMEFLRLLQDFCMDVAASPGYRVLHLDPDGAYRTEVHRVAVK